MRHSPWLSVSVGICFGLHWSHLVAARDDSTAKPELTHALADAHSSWTQFRQAFNLTYAEIANSRFDSDTKSESLDNKITIKRDGTKYVGVLETPKDDRWEGKVYGRNDRYRFELRRSSREHPWVIVGLATQPGDDPQALWIPQTAILPLNFNNIALDELARHSVFQPTGVHEGPSGLRTVSFEISDPLAKMADGAMIVFSSGRVTLDPNRSWLPVRKEWMWPSGRGLGGEATEFRTEAGVSFPTKWIAFNIDKDGSPSKPYGSVTVEKLQLGGSTPYRDFTLSAFGLPEPTGSRRIPGYVWLAVIAVVAMALGGFLRSRARRPATT